MCGPCFRHVACFCTQKLRGAREDEVCQHAAYNAELTDCQRLYGAFLVPAVSPLVTCIRLFLRETAECFARLSHRLIDVCLFVCLSVTLVTCIKTVQARITKSSPWAPSRSLVFRDKISCPWVRGFPSNRGVKEGYLI